MAQAKPAPPLPARRGVAMTPARRASHRPPWWGSARSAPALPGAATQGARPRGWTGKTAAA
eukprot:14436745-Alexandrium_andersonii.AAC.1